MTFVQSLKFVFFNIAAFMLATLATVSALVFAVLVATVVVLANMVECWLFAWNNLKYDPRCDS
jgi:hypothetical protein